MNRNTKRLSAAQCRMSSSAAEIFKALGDENRIKIALMLFSGPTNACDFMDELNISQPTLSHHLKVLAYSGAVKCSKDGKWRIYELTDTGKEIVSAVNKIYSENQ